MTVTLATIALMSAALTPPTLEMGRLRSPPAAIAPFAAPIPERVSRMRVGVTGV